MTTKLDRNAFILVVDDFETMRRVIIRNLEQMGFPNIEQASNGRDALRKLDANAAIQLAVIDWNMPVMPGIELLRAIRAHPKWRRLPVLMVTAEVSRHQVQEAAEAGVSDYLVKPFTVGALQAKFDRIISNLSRGKVVGAPGNPTEESAATNPADRPVFEPAPSGGHVPVPVASSVPNGSILVVDDISDNIDVVVGLLKDQYKVQAAKSGERALKMLASAQRLPDLILLDVMMPEMDGFEVCRRLKSNPVTADIPVIFLSAADDAKNVIHGLELGAVDYVAKPVNPTVLQMRVRTHLTRNQAFRELKKQHEILADNLRLREDVERMTQHDLKNPLGGILNYADLLLSEHHLPPDQREMINTMADSARMVLNLVNLTLDLHKIESGSYELQAAPVDLAAIVQRVCRDASAELAGRNQTLSFSRPGQADQPDMELQPFKAMGDELLCYSVFGNLIKNAIEAAPDGACIRIVFEAVDCACGRVTVTNPGVVPAGVRANFFDKYATSGKTSGTGLGTYSARMLTEVQNGQIDMCTSDEQQETSISVTLPLPR